MQALRALLTLHDGRYPARRTWERRLAALVREEIKRRHPNEWVCLVDEEAPNMGKVTSGVVYAHDPDRNLLLSKQRHLKSAAILWTGKKRGHHYVIEDDVDRQL